MNPALASGMATSLVEIVIFFAIVLVTLSVWIYSSLRREGQERLRQLKNAEEHYRRLQDFHGLSASDRDLVDRMTQYIRNPQDVYMLLEDQRTFNQAAAKLLEEDDSVSEPTISALRMHLGFTGSPTGLAPRATAELPEGADVLIRRTGAGTRPQAAVIMQHETASMRVRLEEETPPLVSGQAVQIVFRNAAGVFRFDSTVLRRTGTILELNHAERGEREQRRDHYRREISLPVTITPVSPPESSTEEAQSIDSNFVELGGNGGTIVNREHAFAPGDELQLAFLPDTAGSLSVRARVVRVSREGALLHVRFTGIRESERDRVYRALFSPASSDDADS